MKWLKKLGSWIVAILAVIGTILIYFFYSKEDVQKKVDKLETEIKDIEKDIKIKEKERKKVLKGADEHADTGAWLDKEIENAKKKQKNLDNKRQQLKDIFAKY